MFCVRVIGYLERDRDGTFVRDSRFVHGKRYYPLTKETIIGKRNLAKEAGIVRATPFFTWAQSMLDAEGFIHNECDCGQETRGYCVCIPNDDTHVFYLEYLTHNLDKTFIVHPDENNRLRAFLKRPDPFHRVAEILEHHLEVGLDLTAVQANAAEHAAENDKPKKRAKKE